VGSLSPVFGLVSTATRTALGHQFMDESQPLADHLRGEKIDAGGVAARSGEAGDKTLRRRRRWTRARGQCRLRFSTDQHTCGCRVTERFIPFSCAAQLKPHTHPDAQSVRRACAPDIRVAEFEINLRRERQLEGIAKAKAAGVYKGRPASIDVTKVHAIGVEAEEHPSENAFWAAGEAVFKPPIWR